MTSLPKTILLIFVFGISKLFAQSIAHPWKVFDGGGGKSAAGTVHLQSSIGQSAIGTVLAAGTRLEGGYVPIWRRNSGITGPFSLQESFGWNMVSVPALAGDNAKSVLFPNALSQVFGYSAGYHSVEVVDHGVGYWVKFPLDTLVSIKGTIITVDSVSVSDKWNIVGSLSVPVAVSDVQPVPPVMILTSFYGYSPGHGYSMADTLLPGHAYWVKVSGTGKIVLRQSSSFAAKNEAALVRGLNPDVQSNGNYLTLARKLDQITFSDALGREGSLYLATNADGMNIESFELPPVPPGNAFDVRFGSNRQVETIGSLSQGPKILPISMLNIEYPVKLHWRPAGDTYALILEIVRADGSARNLDLRDEGNADIIIKDAAVLKLHVGLRVGPESPREFALLQNYPNPFNPSTTIRYDLPERAIVLLDVYDLLGQRVARLIDHQEMDAGRACMIWDAGAHPSGIYFCRLTATDIEHPELQFSAQRKLLLVR